MYIIGSTVIIKKKCACFLYRTTDKPCRTSFKLSASRRNHCVSNLKFLLHFCCPFKHLDFIVTLRFRVYFFEPLKIVKNFSFRNRPLACHGAGKKCTHPPPPPSPPHLHSQLGPDRYNSSIRSSYFCLAHECAHEW